MPATGAGDSSRLVRVPRARSGLGRRQGESAAEAPPHIGEVGILGVDGFVVLPGTAGLSHLLLEAGPVVAGGVEDGGASAARLEGLAEGGERLIELAERAEGCAAVAERRGREVVGIRLRQRLATPGDAKLIDLPWPFAQDHIY